MTVNRFLEKDTSTTEGLSNRKMNCPHRRKPVGATQFMLWDYGKELQNSLHNVTQGHLAKEIVLGTVAVCDQGFAQFQQIPLLVVAIGVGAV